MEHKNIIETVNLWASQLPFKVRVYFFGSYYKGTAKPDSDLDLAVEFLENHVNAFLLWFDVHEKWQKELSRRFGVPVQLELYEGDKTPHLKKYLQEDSLIIYEPDSL